MPDWRLTFAPAQRPAQVRIAVLGLLILALLLGPLVGTRSVYAQARLTGSTVRTPNLIMVGPSTPKATAPQNYSLSGLAPGASSDYLVNLANDGTAVVPAVDLDATTTSSTALDTDATFGLNIQVDLCSQLWQQAAAASAATCDGTTTSLLSATALANLSGSVDAQILSGLASMATNGRDHLRVRFALPAGAPAGYSSLTSTPRLSIWGVTTAPSAPTAVTATPGDGTILTTWTAPTNNGGAAITTYTVTAAPGGATCTSATPGSGCTLSGLTDGITYSVTVTATNSVGTSSTSTAVTAIPYPATLAGSGNVLWLDGADAATLFQNSAATTSVTAAGQSVAAWKDKSGQHNDVSTTGSAPTEDTSTYTHPSVSFVSNRNLSRSTGFPTGSDYTVAVVYLPNPAPNSGTCYGNMLSSTGAGSVSHAFYLEQGTGLSLWHTGDQVINTGAGVALNSSYVSTGTFTTSSRLAGVDVQARTPVTKVLAYQTNDASIEVGALAGGNGFCGRIGEIAAWSTLLTGTQKRDLQDYLGRKWVTGLVPRAPVAAGTAGNAQIAVTWTGPSYDGGSAITGYTATASPGGATCTSAGTACTITGLTNGTTYTVTVVATNAVGSSLVSNSVTGVPITVPGAPTGVSVTNAGLVSWTAPAGTGGSAITGFTATATSSDSSVSASTCNGGAAATSCTLSNVVYGATYTVTVAAANAAGTGPSSTGATLLSYPSALFATANLGSWYDGNNAAGMLTSGGAVATNGQNIQTINDRGGNSITMTQATAVNQMTVGTLNGHQALASTNASFYNSSSNGTFQTVVSAGAIAQSGFSTTFASPANADTSQRLYNGGFNSFQNNNDWSYGAGGGLWANSLQNNFTASAATSVWTSQSPAAFTNQSSSLSSSYWGSTRGFNGTLGEVLVFNRALSSTERRQAEEYLAHKWAAAITPQAPTITAVTTPSSGQLTVTWTAPAWNGYSAVTGYTVTATAGKTCTAAAGATTCTVTGLTAGNTYGVTMTATNSIGVGVVSAAVNGTA